MTSRDFCFWLQGYFEISGEQTIAGNQVEVIKRHLALVFTHEIDPSMGDAAHQIDLNTVHVGSIFDQHSIGGEVQTPSGPVKYRC